MPKKASIRFSAKHVWDAYNKADTTTPKSMSKRIPGDPLRAPLHRELQGAIPGLEDPDEAPSGTIQANRANSIAQCRNAWPLTNPGQEKVDCDEFPFASTKEGSLGAQGNYSVRYIPDSDNRGSGSMLGLFYERTRRLAGDPFWVMAVPLPGDR